MFGQYFGNYLLEQELLSPKELKHVLNKKNLAHMKLGMLAIQKKYLTFEQVEYVHKLQGNMDIQFGELAVICGFLSEEQLRELVKLQKNEHYLICQVLIEEGYFTLSQINTILDNYRAELGLSKYEFEALKNNDISKVIDIFTKLGDIGDPGIYSEYISLFVRNVVRFIDHEIKLGQAEEIKEYDYHWLVLQNMCGEMELFTGYASNDESLLELGCRFARKTFSGINDYILSSAGEFMNLQNGLFLSTLSEEGMEPELQVQEWKRNGLIIASGPMIKIPVQLSFGSIDFFISQRIPQLWDKEGSIGAVSKGRGA